VTYGLLSFLVAATSTPAMSENVPVDVAEWEALWTEVLTSNVDDAGKIDFAALAEDRRELERVVAFISAVDPESRPDLFPERNDRLAYYINAYNALAMFGIVNKGIPKSLAGFRKFTFFYWQTFTLGGESISLYNLENKIIRPIGEERIHFALNCMVVGCPLLPRIAFSSSDLDEQLDLAARTFVKEERNVQVDSDRSELRLSSIFDFYTEDFTAKAPSLAAYIDRYRADTVPANFKVRFIDYDWTVNIRK
jgi:hypothetical protein